MKQIKIIMAILFVILCMFVKLTNIHAADQKENHFNIYVDSVPSGAEVFVYELGKEKDNYNKKDKYLLSGKTPFIGKVSKSEVTVAVMMSTTSFIENVKDNVPEQKIKKWEEKLEIKDFDFDTATTLTKWNPDKKQGYRLSFGPLYSLRLSEENRVVAFFLPRGEDISVLFPFMPPKNTYNVSEFPIRGEEKGDLRSILTNKFNLSENQINEALESLSHIGKAYIIDKDRISGFTKKIIITFQGQPLNTTKVLEER